MIDRPLRGRVRFSAWLAAGVYVCAAATIAEAQPAGASISGRISDAATGQPVEGVEVGAIVHHFVSGTTPATRRLVTRTGPDGRYAIPSLVPGLYSVSVNHPDYVPEHRGQRGTTNESAAIEIGGSERILDVNFSLFRAGEIRGRLRAEQPTPVDQINVVATSTDGVRWVGNGVSDKDGRFRITQLPPGDYYVRVTGVTPAAAIAGPKREPLEPSFFPGVATMVEAAAVRVASGQVTDGLVFPLRALRLFTVGGQLRADEALSADMTLTLMPLPASGPPRAVNVAGVSAQRLTAKEVKEDGGFTFPMPVTPGQYVVWAQTRSAHGIDAGTVTVDVQSDVADVFLDLQPAGRIAGRVVADRGETLPDHVFFITARWMHGDQSIDRSTQQATVRADGRFTLDGLFGERALHMLGLENDWRIVRIESDGRTVDRFLFGAGERFEDVVVVVSRR